RRAPDPGRASGRSTRRTPRARSNWARDQRAGSEQSGRCRRRSPGARCSRRASSVVPFCGHDALKHEGLAHTAGCNARSLVKPGGDIGIALVVSLALAVRGLVFLTEMAACRLLARERVPAHELRELEEVSDPPRSLELLVQLVGSARHQELLPEGVSQLLHSVQGLLEAARVAAQTAAVPEQLAEPCLKLERAGTA